MQIYALDNANQLVSVGSAQKKIDYRCPQCQERVRLRGGPWRLAHFYHLSLTPCKSNPKSPEHLHLQLFLKREIGEGQIFLEKRFEKINRIGDAVWEDKKIVFEIQCSPISKDEVRARVRDYAKEGYGVVWILHKALFGRSQMSQAQKWLYDHCPHYYSNMNQQGQGMIYDQFCILKKGRVEKRGKPLYIDVKRLTLFRASFREYKGHLRWVLKRRRKWKFGFSGDLSECAHLDHVQRMNCKRNVFNLK